VAAAAEAGEHRAGVVVVDGLAERFAVKIDDRVGPDREVRRRCRVLDFAARVNQRRLDWRAVRQGGFDIRCRDEVDFQTE
jgi:hypothetical protein